MSNIDQQDKEDMDAVSRAYRDARDNDDMLPPPALDDAIRAAARRAVHARPQPVGKTWIRKWTPQLAVAAVVVLSVSVVFVSVEERPDLAPAPIQKIALNRSAEAPATVKAPLETKIIEAPPPPLQSKMDVADARDTGAARGGMEKKAAAPPVILAEPQILREQAPPVAKQELNAPRMVAPPPPPLAAATPVAPPVHAPPAQLVPPAPASAPAASPRFVPTPEVQIASPAAPAPFPGTIADASAPKRKEARADAGTTVVAAAEPKALGEKIELSGSRIAAAGSVRSRDAAEAVANAPAKPASVAPSPAIGSTTATTSAVPPPLLKQLAPTPAPAAPSPSGTASALPPRALEIDAARMNAQSESAGVRAFSKDDYKLADKQLDDERPGPWLKRLQELREQGKLKELREEIVRFQKRHPAVVLPKNLTELPPD